MATLISLLFLISGVGVSAVHAQEEGIADVPSDPPSVTAPSVVTDDSAATDVPETSTEDAPVDSAEITPADAPITTDTQQAEASSSAPNPVWNFLMHPFRGHASTTDASTTDTASSTPRFDWRSLWPFHQHASSTAATSTDIGTSTPHTGFLHFFGLDKWLSKFHKDDTATSTATTTIAIAKPLPPEKDLKRKNGPHFSFDATVSAVSKDTVTPRISPQTISISLRACLRCVSIVP